MDTGYDIENEWFAVYDGDVSARKYSWALDGASIDELRNLRDCVEEVIDHMAE